MKTVPKILIIEDDQNVKLIIKEIFATHHKTYEVIFSDNLIDARQIIENEHPDLAIVDLHLNLEKGSDILPGKMEQSDIPFIFLTVENNLDIAVDIMKSGAFDYFVKSEEIFNNLPKIIDNALEVWKERKKNRKIETMIEITNKEYPRIKEDYKTKWYNTLWGVLIVTGFFIAIIWYLFSS